MITVKILIFETLTTRLKRQNVNQSFKMTKKILKKTIFIVFSVVFLLQFVKVASELIKRGNKANTYKSRAGQK